MDIVPAGPRTVQRGNFTYDAIVWYCSLDDEKLQRHLIAQLVSSGVACWPDPGWIRSIAERHEVLRRARDAGLVRHPTVLVPDEASLEDACRSVGHPCVVKIGNLHGGEGKFLVSSEAEAVEAKRELADRRAIVEPFFSGASYRVFVAGAFGSEETVTFRYDNPSNWIKNAPGCQIVRASMASEIRAEALRAHRVFQVLPDAELVAGTLLSGVDYVREDATGEWRFLEWNGFPWLAADPEVERLGRAILDAAMTKLETT